MIKGVHHLSIIASSEMLLDFYKVLGFNEKKRIERSNDTIVLMDGQNISLEFFIDSNHPCKPVPEPLGLRFVSFGVNNIEDTIKRIGISNVTINTDWFGEKYCNITDPDGNIVQLHE